MSFGEVNGTASDASGGASGGAHINTVSVEAIAEFKATGSAFSAEYGRSTNTIPRAAGRYGNLGFNALRAPGSIGFDAGIHKSFVIHEQHRLTFRLEAFNAANHMNPNAPVNTLSNPNFGRINGGSSGRNIQLALKYAF